MHFQFSLLIKGRCDGSVCVCVWGGGGGWGGITKSWKLSSVIKVEHVACCCHRYSIVLLSFASSPETRLRQVYFFVSMCSVSVAERQGLSMIDFVFVSTTISRAHPGFKNIYIYIYIQFTNNIVYFHEIFLK